MVERSSDGGSDRFVVDGIEVEVEIKDEYVYIIDAFDDEGTSLALDYETKVRMEMEIEDFLRDEY